MIVSQGLSTNKAKTTSVHRAYEGLRIPIVADGLARRLDSARKRRVGDRAATPNSPVQLVLRDQPVGIGGQIGQQLKHLRLKINRDAATTQLALLDVEFAVA